MNSSFFSPICEWISWFFAMFLRWLGHFYEWVRTVIEMQLCAGIGLMLTRDGQIKLVSLDLQKILAHDIFAHLCIITRYSCISSSACLVHKTSVRSRFNPAYQPS